MTDSFRDTLRLLLPWAAALAYGMLTVLVGFQSIVAFGSSGVCELGFLPAAAMLFAVVHLVIAAFAAFRSHGGDQRDRLTATHAALTAAATGLVALGPLVGVAIQAAYGVFRPDSASLVSPAWASVVAVAMLFTTCVSALVAGVIVHRVHAERALPEPLPAV